MQTIRFICAAAIILIMELNVAYAGEVTVNASGSSNYIWRGLTQSQNEATISGGMDYASDTGFYVGTWVSNVNYAPNDAFSYENDLYLGFSNETNGIGYDVGYLYYNYDSQANFDFGEIYGELSYGGFALSGYILANTEAKEGIDQDFGFGEAYYVSLGYEHPLKNDFTLGVHIGRHAGDFNEAFNGVPGDYTDYSVSLSKNGFSFMVTDTDLSNTGPDPLDNDAMKIVVSYTLDLDL